MQGQVTELAERGKELAQATETLAAMAEADEIARTHHARFGSAAELFDGLEKNSGQ